MKKLIVFVLALFQIFSLNAQKKIILSGRTNLIYNGKAVLVINGLKNFYSYKLISDTVLVKRSEFRFEGYLSYPQQFRIVFIGSKSNYISESFFLEAGNALIEIDKSKHKKNILELGYPVVLNGSKTHSEYENLYLPLFDSVNKKISSFFKIADTCDMIVDNSKKQNCIQDIESQRLLLRNIRDSILLMYAKQFPSSKILPWMLYDFIKRNSYKSFYEDVLHTIIPENSSEIISTLSVFLNKQKSKTKGAIFPLFDFIQSKISLVRDQKPKFILVEFWFSNCIPCIEQFNYLSPIYEKYNQKGFEIVAVSTDSKKTLTSYSQVINSKNYKWKQILDTNGVNAALIDIYKYPTNFLVDSNGKIISTDITIDELSLFLSKNTFNF